jgi:MFS family permease
VQVVETTVGAVSRGYGFVKRQQRDWKISAARSNISFFLDYLVDPYLSVYIIALGATATQLGIINSVGMIIGGLVSPFLGILIDRLGVKRIYLITIALLAMAYLVYGLAQSWAIVIIAVVAYWLGSSPSSQACGVICANSLASEERATGMALCETVGMGVVGVVGPIVGALLVTTFGGVNVSGIRPLFFICLAGTIVTFFLILTQLSNRRWGSTVKASPNFLKGISEVFKQGHNLKRWILITCITTLPMSMIAPYRQVFAHDIKGADQYILGIMVTAAGLVPIVFGVVIGRLADKIGRKKLIYMSMPFVWLSNLILIWAPNTGWLVVAGALQGFFMLSGLPSRAMTRELVPAEQMGRWLGILEFCRMLFAAGSVYLGGIIWDHIGPQYVFLTVIATDVLIRVPLLIGMPETLPSRSKQGSVMSHQS